MSDAASTDVSWLPALIEFTAYGGNWAAYEEALYAQFCTDFVQSKPIFRGAEIAHKRWPESNRKAFCFWHLISEGKVEEDRTPCFRRCERIAWPRPMIEEDGKSRVAVWENQRRNARRVILAIQDFSYVVVLEPRKEYTLVITAYHVAHSNRRDQLRKEWQNSVA